MKTDQLKAVVQQVTNNTTSWIGHRHGENKSRETGQTFVCPAEGELDSIEILSSYVTNDGPVELSLHQFDPVRKIWGPALKNSTVQFKQHDTGKWISFPLNGIHLEKEKTYGFRLKSKSGLVGVGEAAGYANHEPLNGGQEWTAVEGDQKGDFYSYLSLAFKVELRA
jgi:hypothetical protein